MVAHADPVLFGIVSSADHPIITCFGVTAADARIRKATWIEGDRADFAQHADDVVLGERAAEFLGARLGDHVPIGHGVFHVIGVLKTANGFEDGGVFMPLASAQTFFHKEGTSSVITIKLRNKDDAAAFKSDGQGEVSQPDRASKMRSSHAPTRSSGFSRPPPGPSADAACCSAAWALRTR